jgi:protein TonB
LSVAGHAVCLALLILLLPTRLPPAPDPLAVGGIEVAFEPSVPKPEEPPIQAETPPPPIEPPQPEPPAPPDEPVAATEPPPPVEAPAPVIEPPPPPVSYKPAVKPPPKPAQRHIEKPQPNLAAAPTQPAPAAIAAPQTAYAPTTAPAPVPSAEVSPGYTALVSAWLESHKRYPETARWRGEEGRAVLRFVIDRSGRVVEHTVVKSSGFTDLDAAIEEMIRGATLPPFPAGMTQPRQEFTVNIRYHFDR